VASASSRTSLTEHLLPTGHVVPQGRLLPHGEVQAPIRVLAPPGLLRCLIFSWSDLRAKRMQSAAEKEAWEATVCSSAGKFLQQVFQQKVPLTLVDLPQVHLSEYAEMRSATVKVRGVSDSLLIICGSDACADEELWARQLGVWTYLPEVERPAEIDWIFVEARKAVAQRASAYVDSQAGQAITNPRGP
jgi:hypothetical protein